MNSASSSTSIQREPSSPVWETEWPPPMLRVEREPDQLALASAEAPDLVREEEAAEGFLGLRALEDGSEERGAVSIVPDRHGGEGDS